MENSEFIINILEKYIPDEVDILGQNNVKLIAIGNATFAKPKFAQKMDVSSCAEIALSIVAFINHIWWIYDKLQNAKVSNPTINDIKEEIEKSDGIKDIPVTIRPQLDEFLIEVIVHVKK